MEQMFNAALLSVIEPLIRFLALLSGLKDILRNDCFVVIRESHPFALICTDIFSVDPVTPVPSGDKSSDIELVGQDARNV